MKLVLIFLAVLAALLASVEGAPQPQEKVACPDGQFRILGVCVSPKVPEIQAKLQNTEDPSPKTDPFCGKVSLNSTGVSEEDLHIAEDAFHNV